MDIICWGLLFSIGVSDAQKHRIPNKLVLILLVFVLSNVLFFEEKNQLWNHFLGAGVAFTVCFLLYKFKAMAAGDVKLFFVVGLWVGMDNLGDTSILILLAGGVIGVFYMAYYLANTDISLIKSTQGYYTDKMTLGINKRSRMVIPLAPAIVIGLACFYYFN